LNAPPLAHPLAPSRRSAHQRDKVVGMRRWIDVRQRVTDHTALVDHVGNARRGTGFCRTGGRVCQADPAVGVAQERKGIAELFGEGFVGVCGIETTAEDLHVGGVELCLLVTEPVPLDRSTGGIGSRIEPQEDFLAPVVRQLDGSPVVGPDFEIGRLGADTQHRDLFRPFCELGDLPY
jgi:hypothetical protein